MTDKEIIAASDKQFRGDVLKNWTMSLLTLIFVLLYMLALTGWMKPLTDEKMVLRLEPIIFIIIGYYFGRLPAQDNEKALKEEITRQMRKADAAQYAKEQAQQASEAVEEKLKNVKAALTGSVPNAANAPGEKANRSDRLIENGHLHNSVATALNILNS